MREVDRDGIVLRDQIDSGCYVPISASVAVEKSDPYIYKDYLRMYNLDPHGVSWICLLRSPCMHHGGGPGVGEFFS